MFALQFSFCIVRSTNETDQMVRQGCDPPRETCVTLNYRYVSMMTEKLLCKSESRL